MPSPLSDGKLSRHRQVVEFGVRLQKSMESNLKRRDRSCVNIIPFDLKVSVKVFVVFLMTISYSGTSVRPAGQQMDKVRFVLFIIHSHPEIPHRKRACDMRCHVRVM